MKIQKLDKKIILFIVFMILGTMISLQFRTTMSKEEEVNSSKFEYDDILNQLQEQREIGQGLKEALDKNINKRDNYMKTFASDSDDDLTLKHEWESLRLKAGLTNVAGSGVIITLNDADIRGVNNPNLYIVHDADVLKLLNQLKIAGAQAISVNGERLMPTSEIICTGPTIRVNHKRYSVPFVIKAIGNSDKLYEQLQKSDIVRDFRFFNIRIDIQKSSHIEIEKYKSMDKEFLISGLEVVGK